MSFLQRRSSLFKSSSSIHQVCPELLLRLMTTPTVPLLQLASQPDVVGGSDHQCPDDSLAGGLLRQQSLAQSTRVLTRAAWREASCSYTADQLIYNWRPDNTAWTLLLHCAQGA